MRVVAVGALDFEWSAAAQLALDRLAALGPRHHHGVALARRAPMHSRISFFGSSLMPRAVSSQWADAKSALSSSSGGSAMSEPRS